MSRAYQEGRAAYLQGILCKANPYSYGIDRINWDMGWQDARHEEERAEFTSELEDD